MSHGLISYHGNHGIHRFYSLPTTLGFGHLLKKFWELGKEKGAELDRGPPGAWKEHTQRTGVRK